MDKYKYKLVHLTWDDAQSDMGWEEVPEKLEPSIAITVGFLIRETKDHLLIASTYDEDTTNARIQIPKKMILTRKEVK